MLLLKCQDWPKNLSVLGALEIIYWFWNWAGRNGKNTKSLPTIASADTARQGILWFVGYLWFCSNQQSGRNTVFLYFRFFFKYILSGFLLQRTCESQDFGMLSLYTRPVFILHVSNLDIVSWIKIKTFFRILRLFQILNWIWKQTSSPLLYRSS